MSCAIAARRRCLRGSIATLAPGSLRPPLFHQHGRLSCYMLPGSSIRASRRGLLTDALPPFLVPPTVFTGLLLGLWAYKCFMTVVFQEKFIYMPYMPPFARSETIEDYAQTCRPVRWDEKMIRSLDGTKLALVVGSIPEAGTWTGNEADNQPTEVVICYFQGNGSSPPPRLPLLSHVLRLLHSRGEYGPILKRSRYTIVALSYRGYWKSSGRATQRGIELDAQALLRWVAETYSKAAEARKLRLVLWGQSIGAGVASTATASHLSGTSQPRPPISCLILETPFTNVKSMLFALYPQAWLPYKYLSPLLRNHWDSLDALRTVASCGEKPRILLVRATRDEVVPPEEMEKIQRLCADLSFDVETANVYGALHTEASTRREGQTAVAHFIQDSIATKR